MVVKNIESKSKENFIKCITQAAKLSKRFFIVDNGSTDDTLKIIDTLEKDLNLDIKIIVDDTPEFDYLKYKYSKYIKHNYVFVLDDDEIITEELAYEINNVVRNGYHVFHIKWNTYVLDECVDNKSYKYMMFHVDDNILSGNKVIHKLENEEKIKTLNESFVYITTNAIKHYSYPNIDSLVNKSILGYAKQHAKQLFKQDNNISNIQIMFRIIIESMKQIGYRVVVLKQFTSLIKIMYVVQAVIIIIYKYFYYIEMRTFINN